MGTRCRNGKGWDLSAWPDPLSKEIDDPDFLRRVRAVDTAGDSVYLSGRKAIDFGPADDFHIEPFAP